ncbi:MAG: response regulator, partial [Elusimicrobiota bacterium]|nr:response regulator [Elusimicrobiota bacterium]
IDDSNVALIIMANHLAALNFSVLHANDGAVGLALVQKTPPDSIFLDVTMPGMNGIEVLSKLKENPKTAAIPVVMCSAEQTGRDLDAAFSLGAVGYLIKPITIERLKAQIEKILPTV